MRLLTIPEAANRLGLKCATLRSWIYSNQVEFVRVGKRAIRLREEAIAVLEGSKFSHMFLMAEWEQIVDARQLDAWDDYRDVARLGRKTRLQEVQRAILWSIFERVRDGLRA